MQRLLPRRRPAPLWLACALLVAALLVLVAAAARAGAGGRAWLLAAGEQAEVRRAARRLSKQRAKRGAPARVVDAIYSRVCHSTRRGGGDVRGSTTGG